MSIINLKPFYDIVNNMFKEDEIKKVINGETTGSFFPYLGGTYEDIENYIKNIDDKLNSLPNIKAEADYMHYGSGYASYVDIFCYKKDGSSTTYNKNFKKIDGISLYICRLAPVAIFGESDITRSDTGGMSGFLSFENIDKYDENEWSEFVNNIKRVLASFNISLLPNEYVCQELNFEAKIPTIFSDEPYKILDAFFYWED